MRPASRRLRAFLTSTSLAVVLSLSAAGQQRDEAQTARTSSMVAVHILPNSEGTPLATLTAGTGVKVLHRQGEWVRIQFHDKRYGERIGYVLAGGLNFQTASTIGPTGQADAVSITEAESSGGGGLDSIVSETIVVYESLSEEQIVRAIQAGQQAIGGVHGVFLYDAADVALPTMGTLWKGAATASDLRVHVFSTLAWIRQLASNAAKYQRPYTSADVTAEVLEPVLRVVAVAETPVGRSQGAAVRHIALSDADLTTVVHPLFQQQVSEIVDTLNERITRQGVYAKFSLEDVDKLRGPRRDRVFYATVTRDSGDTRNFKVTNIQSDSTR